MPTSSTRHAIDVPGARLAYDDEGLGPPILLVHSALVNRRAWDAMTPLLLDAGYRVIRHDMRGFGESTAEDVEFSPRDDIRAVLDAAGVERAAIVGNSMGGIHALDAVIETPERFVAFGWVGSGIGGFEVEETPEEAAVFGAMMAANKAGDADAEAAWDVRIWVDGLGQPETRVPADIRDTVYRLDRELVAPGRVFGTPIPLDPPANDRLGSVTIPTLVVVGGLDTPETRTSARRLAAGVPGAHLVELPDVAHMVGMEAPDRLAQLLVELLEPLPRWS
ncbi:MAG TPA: alpha/beta hydrolase [Candidatus Deferrimicrobiaceae bacterium]|nr:alpha/beta hydrolase [Candidatus Deferrimicrobiaceae bacterium]